jgi:phosphatidylserine decarboxylase
MNINYFNLVSGEMETEKVYGDAMIRWMYDTKSGTALSSLLCKAPVSVLYGSLQSSFLSHKKIAPFIKNFSIPMEDYIPEEGRSDEDPYKSFNDFFIRRFKPGKRNFPKENSEMGAFAEARYFAYDSILDTEVIPVKGSLLGAEALLANEKWASCFHEGPLLLARLCPVDYHRYHYPDNGSTLDKYRVPGLLHSVNPLALKKKSDIFATNERQVTILETENFGKLAYVEVGAMCVGKIVQSHMDEKYSRGEEKGYFLFGGSTVIVIGEKGRWKPDSEMVKRTKDGVETYVQLGMKLASSI